MIFTPKNHAELRLDCARVIIALWMIGKIRARRVENYWQRATRARARVVSLGSCAAITEAILYESGATATNLRESLYVYIRDERVESEEEYSRL